MVRLLLRRTAYGFGNTAQLLQEKYDINNRAVFKLINDKPPKSATQQCIIVIPGLAHNKKYLQYLSIIECK